MAVRIRMKKLGRKHRPFFRICAMDKRSPRDGRVIEELGYYDPMVREKDARAVLKSDRVDYWLSVGAQPSHKCAVLIKKYGKDGTHVDAQKAAFERLAIKPQAPEAVAIPLPTNEELAPEASAPEASAPEASEEVASEEVASEEVASEEVVADETPAESGEETVAAEAPAEEATEAAPAEAAAAEEPAAEAPKDEGGEEAAEKSE